MCQTWVKDLFRGMFTFWVVSAIKLLGYILTSTFCEMIHILINHRMLDVGNSSNIPISF